LVAEQVGNAEEHVALFFHKIDLMEMQAHICLRLVMKYAESQEKLYEQDIPSEFAGNSPTTSYQHILDIIVRQVLRLGSSIWGDDFGVPPHLDQGKREEAIESLLQGFVQMQEFDIMISGNWNFNLGSGEEILTQLLQLCNPSYDFRPMMVKVNKLALNHLMSKEYLLAPVRQSSIYLASLQLVCQQMDFPNFYTQLENFAHERQILFDLNEVSTIYSGILSTLLE
jgi:hypothetical protein